MQKTHHIPALKNIAKKLEIFLKNLLQNERKSDIIHKCMKGCAHPLSDGRVRGSRMNKGKG